MVGTLIGPATWAACLAALLLPGAASFFLARRHGIAMLWTALAAGAVLAAICWPLTRTPLTGDAALARQVTIYLILVPGFVSLVLGAAIGAVTGRP